MDERAVLSKDNYYFKGLEEIAIHQLDFRYYGWHKCSSIHTNYHSQKRCYDLHIILKGKGHLSIGENNYDLMQGDFFVIHPAEITNYYPDESDPWEYIWIGFSGSGAISYLKNICPENEYVGSLRSLDKIKELFNELKEEETRSSYGTMGYLYNILDEVVRNRQFLVGQDINAGSDLIIQAQRYISENLSKQISITEMSEYLCVERSTLFKNFKRYLKMSPLKYINTFKLRIAQQYICETNINFQIISSVCGFNNYSHFTRCFTEYFGCSPTEMRRDTKYGGISDKQLEQLGK